MAKPCEWDFQGLAGWEPALGNLMGRRAGRDL